MPTWADASWPCLNKMCTRPTCHSQSNACSVLRGAGRWDTLNPKPAINPEPKCCSRLLLYLPRTDQATSCSLQRAPYDVAKGVPKRDRSRMIISFTFIPISFTFIPKHRGPQPTQTSANPKQLDAARPCPTTLNRGLSGLQSTAKNLRAPFQGSYSELRAKGKRQTPKP